MHFRITKNKQILILILIIGIIRILLFPFSQIIDADAVTRTFLTQEWMEHPHWIMSGIWLPLHYYINALALWIWNDPSLTPSILNSLLALFMIFPFYKLVNREFSKEGALMITAIFALSPILFRNQFMGLSETPYLLLVHAMNCLSIGLRANKNSAIVMAGLLLTLAAGIRYEAWLIILITTFYLFIKHFKKAILFGLLAGIFPLLWLLTNYISTGSPFTSLEGNHHWTLEVMNNNAHVDTETYLRRIWFFPFSLMIAIGPIATVDAVRNWVARITTPRFKDVRYLFAILFIFFLIFFIYNSVKGTLLLQHRFIGTLVLFFLPFASYCMTSRKPLRIALHLVLIIGLSFIYNVDNISPLPRLKDQKFAHLVETIPPDTDYLILDFYGWDYTYYWAVESGIPYQNIIIVEGAKNSPDRLNEIEKLLETKDNVSCIVKDESPVARLIHDHYVAEILDRCGDVTIKKIASSPRLPFIHITK